MDRVTSPHKMKKPPLLMRLAESRTELPFEIVKLPYQTTPVRGKVHLANSYYILLTTYFLLLATHS